MKRFIAILILGLLTLSCHSSRFNSKDKLIDALLNEKWDLALTLCNNQYKDSTSIIYSAIKGHVYLANNENDKSLEMFLLLNNEPAKNVWLEWTKKIKDNYKNNSVALYFYGDALARKAQWSSSVKTYQSAVSESKVPLTIALVQNVLGVYYANIGNYDKALDILENINRDYPNFADSYANIGNIYLRKNAADGAYEYFDTAISKSKHFSLAVNGKSCAGIIKFDTLYLKKALSDFGQVINSNNKFIKEIADSNFLLLFKGKSGENNRIIDIAGTSTMSNSKLLDAYNHNKSWERALGYFSSNPIARSLMNNTTRNNEPFRKALESRGYNMDKYDRDIVAGGVSTIELNLALIDKGEYKFFSCFGLFPTNTNH